jgi:uncharacterized heparinase superfamily protein
MGLSFKLHPQVTHQESENQLNIFVRDDNQTCGWFKSLSGFAPVGVESFFFSSGGPRNDN